MNHDVCCPLIVLSSTLHTGTNQLPWMKHGLQAEFWKAPEVFRKGWGMGSFPTICSTFQMCLQMQTRRPRGQTTHILNWFSLTTFGLLVLERCFQGNGRWKRGVSTPAPSIIQSVSSRGEPAARVLGDRAGRWQVHVVAGFWAGGAGTANLVPPPPPCLLAQLPEQLARARLVCPWCLLCWLPWGSGVSARVPPLLTQK